MPALYDHGTGVFSSRIADSPPDLKAMHIIILVAIWLLQGVPEETLHGMTALSLELESLTLLART